MKERSGFLIRASVHRPVTVLMLVLTLGVVGTIAFRKIPLQLAPRGISFPTLSISIPLPDSTPEEVMEEVAKPAEELLRTIAGVSDIRSWSQSDHCRLRIQHSSSVDGDVIYADVRDRMERLLPSLPEGADRYRIFRFNLETDLPIVSLVASYDETVENPDALLEYVVRPKLQAVGGVARVQIHGLLNRRVEVLLDPAQVEAYGVNLQRLIERLRADNLVLPGGSVQDGGTRYLVRMASRFDSLDKIRAYPVNESLALGDIASVDYRRGLQWLARVDGRLCKIVELTKESEANTVETCADVARVIEEELPRDPRLAGFDFYTYWDQGRIIEDSIGSLQETCAWGGLFAVAILYLFLRRTTLTLLVALAIPLSLTLAVVVIFARDGTFNMFSLTGLTLGIGMLIDNAIVIAENIFRYREKGIPIRRAAELGVREVALAVTLATLTTVAVFLPLIFLGGDSNIRVITSELGLPVCYSLVASLLVALTFIPVATTMLGGDAARSEAPPAEGASGSRPAGRLSRTYCRALDWVLERRFLGVVLSVLAFASIGIPQTLIQRSGRNEEITHEIQLDVRFPPYFSLAEGDAAMEKIRIASEPHRKKLGVETVACWFGRSGGTFMYILDSETRTTRKAFIEAIQGELPEIAGVKIRLGHDDEDSAEKETTIQAQGRDPRILYALLQQVGERLRYEDGIIEVTTPDARGQDEIHVGVSREQAQRFRINPAVVSNLVSWALRGAPLADFETEDEELPLWIRFEGSEMKNIGDLYNVPVYSDQGIPIPLVNVADFSVGRSLPTLRRRDGKVTAWLSVVARKDVDDLALKRRAHTIFSELEVPPGYELRTRGAAERIEEELREVIQAGTMGLVLIFVLMGVLFESFVLPLSVLLSIPFMLVGAFWFIYVMGETLAGASMIGFIILLGIVVNNAIVLIDCVNRTRASEPDRKTAILAAGEARLRPILMTACTTICGLAPLIFIPQTGEGFDYRPIAVVVMGGLAASTVFTLLVVPLFYTLFDDLRQRLLGGFHLIRARLAPTSEP